MCAAPGRVLSRRKVWHDAIRRMQEPCLAARGPAMRDPGMRGPAMRGPARRGPAMSWWLLRRKDVWHGAIPRSEE